MFASNLSRTKSIASTLAKHLANSEDAEIKAHMAQYISIIFYSEVETKVVQLIEGIFVAYSDRPIGTFLSKNQASIIRRIKKSELGRVVI